MKPISNKVLMSEYFSWEIVGRTTLKQQCTKHPNQVKANCPLERHCRMLHAARSLSGEQVFLFNTVKILKVLSLDKQK